MTETKIKIEKKEELSGEIWYSVHVNDEYVETFPVKDDPEKARADAIAFYNNLVMRAEAGYPKTELVLSCTVMNGEVLHD